MIYFYTLLIFLLLAGSQELFRRSQYVTLACFGILPFVLIGYWLGTGNTDWFKWVKIFSVIVAVWVLYLCRYTRLGEKRGFLSLIYGILAINILEAVTKDYAGGGIAHICNAVAGAILIVTLPWPRFQDSHPAAMEIDRTGPHRDFLYNSISRGWMLCYTLWNLIFIYLNYPDDTAIHIAVLGSALVFGWKRPELWFQARAFTLGTFLFYVFTLPETIVPFKTPQAFEPELAVVGAGLSLLAALVYVFVLVAKPRFLSKTTV